ncbi:carbohydrate ABC transporter permease [Pseudogracilibacillus sp. SE30717A]|uniref:carbohydrate ABC transporter permease n=1 Tax=Pseudogracilibacillus sp. SE30717A TaxID=3098293 RepID=UPI00300DEBDD
MSKGMKIEFTKILMYIFLGLIFIASIYPIYWMLSASTLDNTNIFKKLTPGTNLFENFRILQEAMPIWRILFNSVFVSGVVTISTVFFGALAGYAFAKFNFKGREPLFFVVLLTMMLPIQITLVPLFIIMTNIGWTDSYLALIVPFMVTPFSVFLMRQQMLSFPTELIESARIDGSSEINTFIKIVLPTMKSACAAVAIITFMQQWGNFIYHLVVINSSEMYTVPLMLSMMVQPGHVIHYGAVMLGAIIGLIPMIILFLFFQKHFVSGALSGSVKG